MVENRPSPLLWPMAYTTACTTVQAVIATQLDGIYQCLVLCTTQTWARHDRHMSLMYLSLLHLFNNSFKKH